MKKKKLPKVLKKVRAGVLGENALIVQLPAKYPQSEIEDMIISLNELKLPNPIIVMPREADFDEYNIFDLKALRHYVDKAINHLEASKG